MHKREEVGQYRPERDSRGSGLHVMEGITKLAGVILRTRQRVEGIVEAGNSDDVQRNSVQGSASVNFHRRLGAELGVPLLLELEIGLDQDSMPDYGDAH
jgi:hypothetical protein